MTEQELDRIMRRVLIDSLKLEDERAEKDQAPSFAPAPRHKRQMRAMLAAPLRWMRRQNQPRWRQVARCASVFFLICAAAFGGVMAFVPAAQATVVRWVVEWHENMVGYMYMGEQNEGTLPRYEIAALPDGFVETVRDTAPGLAAVTYENRDGAVIYLVYVYMCQGACASFDTENSDIFDIKVNHLDGKFFKSRTPGNLNTLTWIDPELNLQFTLDGNFDLSILLHMAENVLCVK